MACAFNLGTSQRAWIQVNDVGLLSILYEIVMIERGVLRIQRNNSSLHANRVVSHIIRVEAIVGTLKFCKTCATVIRNHVSANYIILPFSDRNAVVTFSHRFSGNNISMKRPNAFAVFYGVSVNQIVTACAARAYFSSQKVVCKKRLKVPESHQMLPFATVFL